MLFYRFFRLFLSFYYSWYRLYFLLFYSSFFSFWIFSLLLFALCSGSKLYLLLVNIRICLVLSLGRCSPARWPNNLLLGPFLCFFVFPSLALKSLLHWFGVKFSFNVSSIPFFLYFIAVFDFNCYFFYYIVFILAFLDFNIYFRISKSSSFVFSGIIDFDLLVFWVFPNLFANLFFFNLNIWASVFPFNSLLIMAFGAFFFVG